MKNLIFAVLAVFIATVSFGQNAMGEIKGNVIDKEEGEPGVGAKVWVTVLESKKGTMTDIDGKFTIKPLNPGIYDVHITMTGKQEKIIKDVVVNPDKITWLKDLEMVKNDTLKIVEITTYAEPLIKPEDPTAQTISAKMIKNSPVLRNPKQLIGTISSDISVSADGDVYVRGSRSDAVIYFIDGVKSTGMNGVPGGAIGSITVYTGGVPAKYGDVTGGVVILETKSYFDLYKAKKSQQMAEKYK